MVEHLDYCQSDELRSDQRKQRKHNYGKRDRATGWRSTRLAVEIAKRICVAI